VPIAAHGSLDDVWRALSVKGKIAVKVINHYGDEVLKVYTPGK
jgi:hypothetical protein